MNKNLGLPNPNIRNVKTVITQTLFSFNSFVRVISYEYANLAIKKTKTFSFHIVISDMTIDSLKIMFRRTVDVKVIGFISLFAST